MTISMLFSAVIAIEDYPSNYSKASQRIKLKLTSHGANPSPAGQLRPVADWVLISKMAADAK